VFHQTHQVFHQIKFFNRNLKSCVNTTGVDNDTLDETLDTLDENDDTLDENTYQSIRIFLKLIKCLTMNCS